MHQTPDPPTPSPDPDELAYLAGYDASRFAHPSVAVDVVLLTVDAGGLWTLLHRRGSPPYKGQWALPGGFVGVDESLEAANVRLLRAKAGLEHVFIEQLYTFGDPGRDPRTRVISVASYALVEAARLERAVRHAADGDRVLAAVEARPDEPVTVRTADGAALGLAFDHARILAAAVERIRGKLFYAPIGFELLPPTFTLADLRRVHEVILGRPLNKDSFRRRILDGGLVVPTGERLTGVGHRPPELYRFARDRAPGQVSGDR